MKPGSIACFTVWGRRENSLIFTLTAEAKKRLGIETPVDGRTNFDFSYDID